MSNVKGLPLFSAPARNLDNDIRVLSLLVLHTTKKQEKFERPKVFFADTDTFLEVFYFANRQ